MLLHRYQPHLLYDKADHYRADAADTITDNYTQGLRTNRLKNQGEETLAVADPELVDHADFKPTQLTLDLLGHPFYERDGTPYWGSDDEDYLDEEGDRVDHDFDAKFMHEQARYANRVYGRVARDPSGATVLQYWLFYYYNWHESFIGLHEGDWEMVQVHLTASGQPESATYAQHNEGERCAWEHVQRTASGRPIVYVARGSHASYFSSGWHLVQAGGSGDVASGDAEIETLPQTLIDITAPPRWISWPGHWGSSGDPGARSSPTSPSQGANKEKWESPLTWADSWGCTEEQTPAIAAHP